MNLLILISSIPSLVLIPYGLIILLNPCVVTQVLYSRFDIQGNSTVTRVEYRVAKNIHTCTLQGEWIQLSGICYALFDPNRCSNFCEGNANKGLACFSAGCAWLLILIICICFCVCSITNYYEEEQRRHRLTTRVHVDVPQHVNQNPEAQATLDPAAIIPKNIPLNVGVVDTDTRALKLGLNQNGLIAIIVNPSEGS